MTPENTAWLNNIIELDRNGQDKICTRRIISKFLDLVVQKDYTTISDMFSEFNKHKLSIFVSLCLLTITRCNISNIPSVKEFFVAFEKRVIEERGADEAKKLMTVLYESLGGDN